MPTEFQLDHAQRIVRSRSWGVVTDADLLGHMAQMKQLFAAGVLDASWAQIHDFCDAENLDRVTSQGVGYMARETPWPKECARAFITPTGLRFGLARMYQLAGDQKTAGVRLVQSADEAMAWVDATREQGGRDDGDRR